MGNFYITSSHYNFRSRTIQKYLLLFIFLSISVVYSASSFASDTWVVVGNLKAPRAHHTATTINGTQVLVAGGESEGVTVNSAEIFSSSNGQWQFTGSMSEARQNHAAVSLNDGRVLVAGGTGNSGDLASVEIFNPVSASWTSVASMSAPRTGALATTLSDGRVLVSSGFNSGTALATAEIYDPASDSWSSTNAMVSDATHAREALLLQDGRVFIIGLEGWTNVLPPSPYHPPNTPTRMPQIYDPASNSWSAAAPRNVQQRWGTAVVMNDGRVLSTGGERFFYYDWGFAAFTCAIASEIYDPTTNTWSTTGTALLYQGASASNVLPDGTVLAFGSCSEIGPWRSQQYDPVSGYWSLTDGLAYNQFTNDHNYGASSMLSDGRVVVSGGIPALNSADRNSTEMYLPSGSSPPPPPELHITDLDGGASAAAVQEGMWRPFVTAVVQDQNGNAGEAASVLGYWSYDPSTIVGCTTNNDTPATCTETADYISLDVTNVSFTVTDIIKAGHLYDASANSDPDGDSDGTSISIDVPDDPPLPPPPPQTYIHISDIDGSSVADGKNRWRANIYLYTKNQNGSAVSGATISGSWSDGASGTASCVTTAGGFCVVTSNRIRNRNSSATFTVTGITHDSLNYDSSKNTDPDGSSDGTSITVNKP